MTESNKSIDGESNSGSAKSIITLVGDDGSFCSCQILEIFDLGHWKYALLQKNDGDEPGALVAMRVVQSDGQANFETIEHNREFDFVVTEIEKRTGMSTRKGVLGKHIF